MSSPSVSSVAVVFIECIFCSFSQCALRCTLGWLVFQIRTSSSIHVRITECCTPNRHWKTAGAPLFRFVFRFAGLKPDPNFTGRHLFWLGLRVVDFIHTFYSRAVIQRQIDVSPAVMEYGLARKDCGLSTYKPWTEQAGGLDSILHEAAQDFEVF